MMLAIVYSRSTTGIAAPLVTVETHLSGGLPKLNIVGLPEAVVKESKDRVRSALMNSGFEFPARRITVNLAPADIPKEGARFDLPIALGILAASGQIPSEKLADNEFSGELALSGELRPVRCVLPMTISAKKANRILIIPEANASEAAIVKEASVLTAKHLLEVCAYLKGEKTLKTCEHHWQREEIALFDLADVKGQAHAKIALEVAAAGRHSLLFMGPPGTGKTMLANRLTGILPQLTEEQALEVATIASVSSTGFDYRRWQHIPFRAPHHSSSSIALVGGGRPPKPGEISLAHNGVLFLDELPEYDRQVLEALREPLESGQITISRAAYQTVYPASFQFIAAMNPCPCGYAGSRVHDCHCSHAQIQRYIAKLSGPLLDRIDLHVEVPAIQSDIMAQMTTQEESSSTVKQRVMAAREIQMNRQGKYNAHLLPKEMDAICVLDLPSRTLLASVMKKFNFSGRVYHRILKLARTIADLANSDLISGAHLSQALAYRCLDRSKLSQ